MNKMLKSMSISFIAIAIIMLFLGCTSGKAQTRGNDKGNFQNEEFDAFDGDVEYGDKGDYYQKGLASWYGREFHGKTTASGEKFNMNELTAAHKTLPFGTIVEVKNLENGKTVRVKINDRGPYRGSRIIDLSYAGAKELDIVKVGEASVGIRILKMGNDSSASSGNSEKQYVEPVSDTYVYKNTNTKNESQSNPKSESQPNYNTKSESQSDYYTDGLKLQAGAFYSRKNAENLKSRIETMTDYQVRIVQEGGFYKVRIEGIQNAKEMQRLKNILTEENIPSFSVE